MLDEKVIPKSAMEDKDFPFSPREETTEEELKTLAHHFKNAIDYDDQFEHECLQDAIRDEDYDHAASICIKLDSAKKGSLLADEILKRDKKDEA